ncbi:MAG: ABC transporter ATP-binding protein [Betaproteobacteria bacterium]
MLPVFRFFEKRVNPYPDGAPTPTPKTFFAFMWAASDGLRPYLLFMTLCTAAIGVFEGFLFSMLGQVVDWLSKTAPADLWTTQRHGLLLLGAILVASPLVVGLQALLKHQAMAGNFPMRLRWKFHRLMLSQSMGFYQDEFAGRVATKVMQTALAVRDVWMIVADILVFVIIYFVTLILIVGSFDLWVVVPFGAWLVLYAFAIRFFVPRLGKVAQEQADARSLMTGRVTDAYTNIATVKLFSHTNREAGYVRAAMQDFMQTVYRQWRMITTFEVVNQVLSVLLIASTTGVVLSLWMQGKVAVGGVAAATAMALRLNGISHWIMWEFAALFEHIGTVRDGMTVLSRPHTVVDAADAKPLTVSRGEIRFDDVTFAYGAAPSAAENTDARTDIPVSANDDTRANVIENLNLTIRAGEKIGLVGRSGAGKSTIVNLLLRFYDLREGRILIDSQDIAHVTQDSLRTNVGMVTQDTSLLHRSVRENIIYGRPDASDADMIAAAKRAEAHEFIQTLTDPAGRQGYDAHVGERGVKLSGGQRQRIAIARVKLKDAPILLLDEATSALDSEVEAAIQASLYKLMEGKTVVAIAHRLSTIAAMDRLIVLDEGRVVEEGNHQTLLAMDGLYARLWAHQSGGFLGDSLDESELKAVGRTAAD